MNKKTLNEMKRRQGDRATQQQARASSMSVKTLGRVMDPWLPPTFLQSPFSKKYVI